VADVVGIIFPNGVKTYYFDPAGLELLRGDRVVVQTCNGAEIGQVVEPPHAIDDSEIPAPLKKVTRVATGKDLEARAASENLRREAMTTCRALITTHGLDMKLVGADISFGGEKITFNFYSEERVDFRALVADLAKTLKTRIELRQVGAREEARMVGGLGPCGRHLCCTLFMGDDEPVSIRMAKEQNLPLNPMKISGLCGRLMCCLKYEQEQYVRFRKEAPPKGTPVSGPAGEGVIVGYNVPKDAITVRFEDGSYTDIRLAGCECQEGGGLLVIPEVEEPAPFPLLSGLAGTEPLRVGEDKPEALAVVEAEITLGENGEPVEVIVAESSRRSRPRRGRGRRGGKNRSRAQASGEDTSAGSTGPSGETTPDTSGANRAPEHKRGQQRPRHPDRRGEGSQGRPTEGSGGEQAGSSGSTRSRRRRRPRRAGSGNAAGDGGSGNSGGAGAGESSGD